MNSLFSTLLSPFRKSRKIKGIAPRERKVLLGLETLEARDLMSVTMAASAELAATTASTTLSGITFTLPPVPTAPVFTIASPSQTEIDVSWQPASWASGYEVENINAATGSITTYNVGAATSLRFTGLSTATLYVFDVAAYDVSGTTWSTLHSAITQYNPASLQTYSPALSNFPLWDPIDGPSPFDVRQGNEADCWLIASLSEVAARAPQDIENMFHYDGTTVENGQTVGLYTVRLFNNADKPVSITVDTQLPGGGYYEDNISGYNEPVLWVALAEKAYAEANGLGDVTSKHDGVDSYLSLDYGDPRWALSAITGQSGSVVDVNSSNLNSAWDAGEFVVICTDTPASPYIVPNHDYAVLGGNGSEFELLNHWGIGSNGYAAKQNSGQNVYGLFEADMSFIDQNFSYLGEEASGAAPALLTLTRRTAATSSLIR